MRHTASLLVVVALLASGTLMGCGSNSEEGITPSTPTSNKELNMTGEQRQEQNAQQYQQKSDQEFDAAQAQGEKAAEPAKPAAPPANPQ